MVSKTTFSKSGFQNHFLSCPKVVSKTTFPKSGFENHFLNVEKWFRKPLFQKVVLKTTFLHFFKKWFSKPLFFYRISKVVLETTFWIHSKKLVYLNFLIGLYSIFHFFKHFYQKVPKKVKN